MQHFLLTSIILLFIFTIGCNPNPTEEGIDLPPIIDISMSYVNEEGEDLLDENTLRFFNIYYLQLNEESGEFEQVEVRSVQYSFYRDNFTNLITLRVFPNREFIDGYSKTLIESPRDDFDTLRVYGRKEGRGAIADTIWYNDEKVWETAPAPPRRYFVITKSQPF